MRIKEIIITTTIIIIIIIANGKNTRGDIRILCNALRQNFLLVTSY